MNERVKELAEHCGFNTDAMYPGGFPNDDTLALHHFAEAIVKECISKIEEYQIPVGNSRSGELACEWTYNALKDIREDIKETFGIK